MTAWSHTEGVSANAIKAKIARAIEKQGGGGPWAAPAGTRIVGPAA